MRAMPAATTAAPRPPGTLRLARVAFTGRLASMSRDEAQRVVRDAGGVPVTAVSRRTSMLVVGMDGWPLLPDGTVSRKLERAEAINRRGGRLRVIGEEVFLELAGLEERKGRLHKSYPAEEVGALLGLDPAMVRRWEALGLVRSEAGRYDFKDIVSLRTIGGLVAAGVDPATIGRSVRGLASILPGTDRPLCQLSIVVEHRRTLVAELGGLLLAPDGQWLLDFGGGSSADAAAARAVEEPLSLRGEPHEPSAEEWLERGAALEELERLEEAGAAYREALRLRPQFAEAQFNLGNVLRALGRTEAAEERYCAALEQDAGFTAAWYNLADLQEETGRLDEAIESLRRALRIDSAYLDAHFNLAACLEQAGRPDEARLHWSAYLALDPDSEWAAIARTRQGQPPRGLNHGGHGERRRGGRR